jgi:nucleoside recognition membrane protein YjiH
MTRFLLPSIAGALFFFTPIFYGGKATIPMAVMVDWLRGFMGPVTSVLVILVCLVTTIASVLYSWSNAPWLPKNDTTERLFNVSPIEILFGLIGTVVGIMVWLQIGPEIIIGEDTGKIAFVEIGGNLLLILFIGCFLLPLITDFGFMEFVGTLAEPVFTRLFGLPGRSALDAITSFVVASNVGLIITVDQYRQGYYTARDAAVVATNFTVISIPFIVLISNVANLDHLFFPWFATILVACFTAALISPRLPPLAGKPRTYFENATKRQAGPKNTAPIFRQALDNAVRRSLTSPKFVDYLRIAVGNYLEVIFSIAAISIGVVAVSTIIINHTPVFDWLSAPLVPLMRLLGLAPAEVMAPGFIIGFLELFLPTLLTDQIASDYSRFVLTQLSLRQYSCLLDGSFFELGKRRRYHS